MSIQSNAITIIKLTAQGKEHFRYPGTIISETDHSRLIEARFNHNDMDIHGVTLRENDRFIERYYDDRWYNILEARDRDDDHLKGWYCNVARPAQFTNNQIRFVDLALDVLAYPDGRFLILDEGEFEALNLDPETRQHALESLDALVAIAKKQGFSEEIYN